MVLSRFWLVIFISSIVFVIFSLFSGNSYTIDHVLNGKKDDPILISEKYIDHIPAFIKDSINKSEEKTFIINRDTLNADTTYVYKNKVVKIFPNASGRVISVNVSLGDKITKGQTLAVIKSADVAGNYADLEAADNDAAIAEKEFRNEEQLFKNGISSEKDFGIAFRF